MKNADQPAFPIRFTDNQTGHNEGLTKREHFAAMAMQGLLSNTHYMQKLEAQSPGWDMNKMLVMESIDMADELLKHLDDFAASLKA